MKFQLKLIAFFLLVSYSAGSQDAVYPVINYTTKEYGRNFHPANMAIVQDKRGIIYAANGFKLLEFDGSRWNSYPISKENWILSLAVDSSGMIYAGAQNEFGLFEPDKRGELKYRSLSDSLDIQDIDFTNIWKVHAFEEGVAFQSEEKLFLYRNGKTEVIKPETSFHTSFVVNNRLFVRQRGHGLMEWKDNVLVKINGGEIFDTTGIFLMLPFGSNGTKVLIGTQEKGFWVYDPQEDAQLFSRFRTEDTPLFEKSAITGGVITGEGSIAVSTMLNGIIVIDTAGKTKAIINKRKGLSDNDVKQVILDQNQNLWLALNNGISRIEISSPLSFYTERSGISGSINTLVRYQGLLYAGTTAGLYVQDTDSNSEFPFKAAYNLSVPVRSMVVAGRSLLAGTDAGLFQIMNNNISRAGSEESFALYYDHDLKLLLSGGPKGLTIYKNEGFFGKLNSPKIEGEDIIGISAESNPEDYPSEYWLGTRYNGIIRIRMNKDLLFDQDNYNIADGLPDGWIIPTSFNSITVFETSDGLYSFTNENVVKESLPDSLKDNKDFVKGFFSAFSGISKKPGSPVTFLVESKDKNWVCSDNRVSYIDKEDPLQHVRTPFNGIEAGKLNFIYPEENGICWIGTSDGLVRYDGNITKDYNQAYPVLIRKASLPWSDSTLFSGSYFCPVQGSLSIVVEQPPELEPTLTYRNNSIRFEYSASFYEYPEKLFFSYKLEGTNSRWSQWTPESSHEYSGLREGKYTFVVKARNIYETESTPSYYGFVILPPWYRSVPAFFLYAVIAFIIFWLFARIYSFRLKRENIRLEGIVSERTAEVVRQKDEIVHKNTVLEHQKKEIEDSIRYAQRIQSAVIPSEKVCHEILPETFVFFRPLNIVSGDFYWISSVGNKIIYTAADCTGHGVPGAFMSMLGVAFLNEIVNKDNIIKPDMILNKLRGKVIQALQQQGISGETRDGMDIAIVSIDLQEKMLEYAGAYNPLIMIRKGEVFETAGDKMPIGYYENMHGFRNNEIKIEKGDAFYMYSDGYEDQFGGPDGKKFKSRRLKNLLLEICNHPMEQQREILEKNFTEWKGDLPQIDDIVVIGLAIR